jgi:hypothetical protein
MRSFLRDWLHNLWVTVLAVIGVGLFMLIFMRIFYPDTISLFVMMGKWTAEFATALKLWPIIVLMILVSAFPRRWRR